MINYNNIEKAKELLDRIEYEVVSTKKEARITHNYDDDMAYRFYKEDLGEQLEEVKDDVIAIIHANRRDYSHLFAPRNEEYNNGIDIKRCGFTKKQLKDLDGAYIESDGEIFLETSRDIDQALYDEYIAVIEKNIERKMVSCTGYSQGDWDKYQVIFYKNTKKKEAIETLCKNISYLFTVTDYNIELVTIEERKYTGGYTETVELVEEENNYTSYDGYIDKATLKDLEKQGYTIIRP